MALTATTNLQDDFYENDRNDQIKLKENSYLRGGNPGFSQILPGRTAPRLRWGRCRPVLDWPVVSSCLCKTHTARNCESDAQYISGFPFAGNKR